MLKAKVFPCVQNAAKFPLNVNRHEKICLDQPTKSEKKVESKKLLSARQDSNANPTAIFLDVFHTKLRLEFTLSTKINYICRN